MIFLLSILSISSVAHAQIDFQTVVPIQTTTLGLIDIEFSNDGGKMFIVNTNNNDVIYQYVLDAPFDVRSTIFTHSFSVASQNINPRDVAFSDTGLEMFVVGIHNNIMYQYTLTTSYDISTSNFTRSFFVDSQETDLSTSMTFSDTGLEMFVTGMNTDDNNYIHQYTLAPPFNVSNPLPAGNFSVASKNTDPHNIVFSDTGLEMFVVGVHSDNVNQYTLTVPYDISTSDFVYSFSVAPQEIDPTSMAFSDTGLEMFVVGISNDNIYQYTLTVPYDISTSSFDPSLSFYDISASNFVDPFSVANQDIIPTGITFSDTGLEMFVIGTDNDNVNQYTLTAPYDPSASNFTRSFSVAPQEIDPRDIVFSDTGLEMFVVGVHNDNVNQYTLTVPYDISTSNFVYSLPVGSQETGITFSNDGRQMFVVGVHNDNVNQYTLTVPYDISTSNFIRSFSVTPQETGPTGIAFSDTGLEMFIVGISSDNVNQYTLTAPYDISTSNFVYSFSVAPQETGPTGIAFSDTGLEMFILGSIGDKIYQYTLTIPYNVSTAFFVPYIPKSVDSTLIPSQNVLPTSIAFSDTGFKMFVVDIVDSAIYQHTLTNPFDIFDPISIHSFSVASEESVPTSISFSDTGLEMFVIGAINDSVYQYTLTSPFNISNPILVGNFSVASYETSPQDIAFSNTGLDMFVIGTSNDSVYQYTLTSPFNISNPILVGNFSVASYETSPQDIAFSNTGLDMFVIGTSNDSVYQYTLTSPFNISNPILVGNFSVASYDDFSTGMEFSDTGLELFVVGATTRSVYQYTLTSPFEISPMLSTFIANETSNDIS